MIEGFHAKEYNERETLLIKDIYPVIFVKYAYKWHKIMYNMDKFLNYTANGTHYVVVEGHHQGEVMSQISIIYDEKERFSLYRPLFPSISLLFNRTLPYKIVWEYDNISNRYFEILDNGTGYTMPPFKHGHEKHVIFSGKIIQSKIFRNDQDIIIGLDRGRKLFGFNFEASKEKFKTLRFMANGGHLNMYISTDVQDAKGYRTYINHVPIPDTGGGGGGSTPPPAEDKDHDGLVDSVETGGWTIYVKKKGSNKEVAIHVTSSPYSKDTDGDGLSDYEEFYDKTNPRSKDTDGDGLTDRQEVEYYHTNPDDWSTHNDGIDDYNRFNYWLLLGYFDGDNNLHSEANSIVSDSLDGIRDSLYPFSTAKVSKLNKGFKMVIMVDGNGDEDTKTYEFDVGGTYYPVVTKHQITILQGKEQNMASPSTLSTFIKKVREKYWQYNHVGLIIFDHGGGWTGLLQDIHPKRGVSEYLNIMSTYDFKKAILASDVHINFMFFDACLMSSTEFIYEMRGLTDYMVLSEDIDWGGAYNYDTLMTLVGQKVISNALTAKKLANIVTNSHVDYYSRFSIAAINMANLNHFIKAIEEFSEELKNIAPYRKSTLRWLISQTLHMHDPLSGGEFFNHSFRDLGDFVYAVRDNVPELINAAGDVLTALSNLVVFQKFKGCDYTGISIFLPDLWWVSQSDFMQEYREVYRKLDFSESTEWNEFIETLYGLEV